MKLEINNIVYNLELNDIAFNKIEKEFKSFGTCEFLIKNKNIFVLSKVIYHCFQFKIVEKGLTFEEFLNSYPYIEETFIAFEEIWSKLKEEKEVLL